MLRNSISMAAVAAILSAPAAFAQDPAPADNMETAPDSATMPAPITPPAVNVEQAPDADVPDTMSNTFEDTPEVVMDETPTQLTGHLASQLIKADIYHVRTANGVDAAPADPNAAVPAEAPGVVSTDDGWDKVANVSDLLISPEGQVIGYVTDVGGFLGIGSKRVVLTMETVKPARYNDADVLTIDMTKEELEALPEYADPE